MQGIPTRSDAVKLDPEYAEVVRQYDLLSGVERMQELLPPFIVHNYLNGIYHDAGMHHFAPPYEMMWRIPAITVPKKVRQAVDAKLVTDRLLSIIATLRERVEQARPLIDRRIERAVGHRPDYPYKRLFKEIVIERSEHSATWRYSFNVYELAMATLGNYETLIRDVVKSRLVPFTQLSRINEYLQRTEQNVRFVSDEARLLMWLEYDPSKYESKEGTVVHELHEQNEAIHKRSDVCIGFAEAHFFEWMGGISAGNLLPPLRDGQDRLFTFTSLWHRTSFGSRIHTQLDSRGSVVINGVTYARNSAHGGRGLSADAAVPIEIVNLLRVPVRQDDGSVIEPEAWSRLEGDLVYHYVRYGNELARDVLLESYSDEDPLIDPTGKRQIERLNHVLGRSEMFAARGIEVE